MAYACICHFFFVSLQPICMQQNHLTKFINNEKNLLFDGNRSDELSHVGRIE